MKTKKIYIAPSVEVVAVLQECPLLDFSTKVEDNTGIKDPDGPGTEPFSKQHNGFSMWEEYDNTGNKSLWD